MRLLDHAAVRRYLPMSECIEAVRGGLAAHARGETVLPLRSITWLPERVGALGTMPAWLGSPPILGVKVVSFFPGNRGTDRDSHQGAVLLFEPKHGSLVAIVDATEITSLRTAAASAVATDLLARKDARTLAILGAGTQARTHLAAVREVRPVATVRVWSRTPAEAEAFAERERERHDIELAVAPSARDAVDGADVICTTTSAKEPVLEGAWLAPGAHVNAVGACTPDARELDTEAVTRSRLYVDSRESALNEPGDLLVPLRDGAIDEGHVVGEIGDVIVGQLAGRGSADEITLFKSLGIAIEDLAAAHHAWTAACRSGGVPESELGGRRHDA